VGDISEHFDRAEFACNCGTCGHDTVDTLLLEALEAIREKFKAPIKVSSGNRCKAYNKTVGGAQNSQHLLGRAADIQVDGVKPSVIAGFAMDLGMSVGSYDTFTHVDSRSGPVARW
jgi:uncharacterized protein YcbK (DUF882 family)